mmetsp:Transcript_44930/g.118694  ORF Transcript_44930/g.118694 Transcript_44930/m.118694 type:complete len:234 (-) Transcript_44930:24-725(-)
MVAKPPGPLGCDLGTCSVAVLSLPPLDGTPVGAAGAGAGAGAAVPMSVARAPRSSASLKPLAGAGLTPLQAEAGSLHNLAQPAVLRTRARCAPGILAECHVARLGPSGTPVEIDVPLAEKLDAMRRSTRAPPASQWSPLLHRTRRELRRAPPMGGRLWVEPPERCAGAGSKYSPWQRKPRTRPSHVEYAIRRLEPETRCRCRPLLETELLSRCSWITSCHTRVSFWTGGPARQ